MSNPKDPTQVDLFLNAPTGMETVDPAQDLTLILMAWAILFCIMVCRWWYGLEVPKKTRLSLRGPPGTWYCHGRDGHWTAAEAMYGGCGARCVECAGSC